MNPPEWKLENSTSVQWLWKLISSKLVKQLSKGGLFLWRILIGIAKMHLISNFAFLNGAWQILISFNWFYWYWKNAFFNVKLCISLIKWSPISQIPIITYTLIFSYKYKRISNNWVHNSLILLLFSQAKGRYILNQMFFRKLNDSRNMNFLIMNSNMFRSNYYTVRVSRFWYTFQAWQ